MKNQRCPKSRQKITKNVKNRHFWHFRDFPHSQPVNSGKMVSFDRSILDSQKCQFWTVWYLGLTTVSERSLVNGSGPSETRARVAGSYGRWCTRVVVPGVVVYRVVVRILVVHRGMGPGQSFPLFFKAFRHFPGILWLFGDFQDFDDFSGFWRLFLTHFGHISDILD